MLSVVVPCFNEERNLPILASKFESIISKTGGELILVDNGSTDNSPEVIEHIVRDYKFIRTVRVEKNVGYGHGIFQGIKHAKGDVIACTHADLQCDPNDVARAYEVFINSDKKTLVKGKRVDRFSVLTTMMHVVADLLFLRNFNDIYGQPKLFHRDLVKHLGKSPMGFEFDFYLQLAALRQGYKVKSIPVHFGIRKYGYSKWATTTKSKIKFAINQFWSLLKIRFS